jgi:hypothetical protein
MGKGGTKAPAAAPESEDNSIKITREVTSIAKGGLADGLFEVPKGYKKTAQPTSPVMRGKGK